MSDVAIVTFATAVGIYQVIPTWWFWVGVLFSIYLFIDQFRTFWFRDNANGRGLVLFVTDQAAHILSIIGFSWLATGWQPADLRYLFPAFRPMVDTAMLVACIVIVSVWPSPSWRWSSPCLDVSAAHLNPDDDPGRGRIG